MDRDFVKEFLTYIQVEKGLARHTLDSYKRDLERLHAELREPLDLAWKTVLGHGRFVNGPEVAAFEAAFARYCGAEHCVGVANGTDAIMIETRWRCHGHIARLSISIFACSMLSVHAASE